MRNFRDKIAVITGAGSGIGQALAIELAKKGAILVLSDKNETGLADTKKRVETIGAQCHTYVVDVSDVKAVTAFCTKVLKEHEHIDLLFNNLRGERKSRKMRGLFLGGMKWVKKVW